MLAILSNNISVLTAGLEINLCDIYTIISQARSYMAKKAD